MVSAARNRSKSANVSKTAIDQVGSFLQDLSAKPKEELSLREAIDQLREPIQTALAKGYSYPEIATMLGEQGITTTASTLKRYISLGNSSSRGRRAKTTRATKAKADASDAASEETAPKPRGRRKSTSVEAADETEKPKGRTKTSTKTATTTKPASRGRKKASS